MILPDDIVETGIALRDQYFDLKGLSVYCNLGVSTLRKHIRAGGLPFFKIDGKVLVKRSEFDFWMQERRRKREEEINTLVDEAVKSLKSKD